MERITGTVDFETTSDHVTTTDVDLTGYAGSRPVTLKGKIRGPKETAAIDLAISATTYHSMKNYSRALPAETGQRIAPPISARPESVARPTGRTDGSVDVKATIHRELGKDFTNRFIIRFHDASVQYDVFPIPLENVSGLLDLRTPGGWECHDFQGVHEGGVLHLDGQSYAPPGSGGVQDRIYVVIQGDQAWRSIPKASKTPFRLLKRGAHGPTAHHGDLGRVRPDEFQGQGGRVPKPTKGH